MTWPDGSKSTVIGAPHETLEDINSSLRRGFEGIKDIEELDDDGESKPVQPPG